MKTTFPHTIHHLRSKASWLMTVAILVVGFVHYTLASDATWNLNPISGDWNTATNWTPATVPGQEDIGTFAASNMTQVTVSTYTIVGGLSFAPGASSFTFTALPTDVFQIDFLGITNNSGVTQSFVATVDDEGNSGAIGFTGSGTIGTNTMFIAQARRTNFGDAGDIEFDGPPSAGMATIINEGGETDGSIGGHTRFFGRATAGEATIIANGGTVSGAGGGQIQFLGPTAAASNSILIANGGSNGGGGGEISFYDNSTGDSARVELFGNGTLTLISTGVMGLSIGSLEGEGIVNLSAFSLSVGANNLSTTFSGVIQDDDFGPGSLTKIGTGVLTLSGANTYRKRTDVNAGTLVLTNTTGSGVGTGPLRINAGTLGGSGIITGTVTIGTGSGAGAFLAPATGANKKVTLTIQSSLTFNSDATYTYTFKAKRNKARADLVIANGVTINSGASFNLSGQTQDSLQPGLTLTAISNTSANPISGAFSNLPEGGIVTVNGNNLQATYQGGDGNDLTLTVVQVSRPGLRELYRPSH